MLGDILTWAFGLVVLAVLLTLLPDSVWTKAKALVAKIKGLFATRGDVVEVTVPPDLAVILELLRETADLADRLQEAGMESAHRSMGAVATRLSTLATEKLAESIVGFSEEE
jgi:hypothetical protein